MEKDRHDLTGGYVELPVTIAEDAVLDFAGWEFDDGMRGAIDKYLRQILTERIRVIFSADGATSTLWVDCKEDGSAELTVAVYINEHERFAESKIDLFELIEQAVHTTIIGEKAACTALAENLRSLAKRIEEPE